MEVNSLVLTQPLGLLLLPLVAMLLMVLCVRCRELRGEWEQPGAGHMPGIFPKFQLLGLPWCCPCHKALRLLAPLPSTHVPYSLTASLPSLRQC